MIQEELEQAVKNCVSVVTEELEQAVEDCMTVMIGMLDRRLNPTPEYYAAIARMREAVRALTVEEDG